MIIEPENPPPNFIKRILRKYTFSAKINFLALLIGSVTLIITYLLIQTMVKDMHFTELEVAGNIYQKNVYRLLTDITKYKLRSNAIPNDPSINSLYSNIENSFTNLIRLNEQSSAILNTREDDFLFREGKILSPQEIYNMRKESQVNTENPLAALNDKYSTITDNLQSLLTFIGDISNLNYDPEVSTHYLIESTIRSLPEEQDLISRIAVIGYSFKENTENTQKNKFELTALSTLLLSNALSTKEDIEKAIAGIKSNFGSENHIAYLEVPLREYLDSLKNLTQYLDNSMLNFPEKAETGGSRGFFRTGSIQTDTKFSSKILEEAVNVSLEKNDTLWNILANQIDTLLQERIEKIRIQRLWIILFVAGSLAVSIALGYVVLSETNSFFKEAGKSIIRFSKGELNSRIPVSYDAAFEKLRLIVNELGDRIETLIRQLQLAGVQLTTTTTEIAAAAKHQEGTICQQEATVRQILITIGEISSTAKEFAGTMNAVNASAEETSSLASSGKQGLFQMEETMRQMVDASKNIASKLAVLQEKAATITGVITTITKVADQTNMLSFNASIEAEKAGEHGKSFAVIAREIRRLADQTANATLDIEAMISEMMSAVTEGVVGVDKFSEEITVGVTHVTRVSELLSDIITQVQQQTKSYEDVNRGMQIQSYGAEQINEAILQLSDATQQTTISIRQFYTAIEQLTIASKEMQSCVNRMKN